MTDQPQNPPTRTEEQLAAHRTLRRWLPILGFVLVALGLYISAFLIPDLIETAEGPQRYSLAGAAEVASATRTYARIEGGAWDCDSLREVRVASASSLRYGYGRLSDNRDSVYTEVFFTDDSSDVVLFVTLSGEASCESLSDRSPTGYLYTMSSGTRQDLASEARLSPYGRSATFLEFCGYCGQTNSAIGAVFGIVFVALGAAMIVFGRRITV